MRLRVLALLVLILLAPICQAAVVSPVKPYTFVNGTRADANEVNEDFDRLYTKTGEVIDNINAAAGTKASMDSRLDVSLNDDGTIKADVTAGGEWVNPAIAATYVDTSNFTVDGDQTDIYQVNRRLKVTLAGGTQYTAVSAVAYSGVTGKTTVTTGAVLTDPISAVEHSFVSTIAGNGSVSAAMLSALTTEEGDARYVNVAEIDATAVTVGIRGASTSELSANVTPAYEKIDAAAKAYILRVDKAAGPVVFEGAVGSGAAVWEAQKAIWHTGTLPMVGVVTMYAGSAAPAGWLLCNGAEVSRTTYADLFALIGTYYGAGNGSTTFNLPDLRGLAPIGAGQGSGLTNRGLGAKGGAETHALSEAEMPSHTHEVSKSNVYPADGSNLAPGGSHSSYETSTATGGGAAHNNMMPFIALNFIIKY
jgi:microcystin-dependent protein